jgi:NAD(P)-dependent dehydrogenase (short-subunit alcohol dehydrogenase family)
VYLEQSKLSDRVAVVTGLGAACVEALAEAGAKVIIADFDPKVAEEGRDAVKAKGQNVETVLMNVTDPSRVTEVANDVVAKHGRIDILVNNASIARSETPAETVTGLLNFKAIAPIVTINIPAHLLHYDPKRTSR